MNRPAQTNKPDAELAAGNPWYTGSHVAWAERPAMRRLYADREAFLRACVERCAKRTQARPLRLLDAGCGDGYWISRLRNMEGVAITGAEYNPLRVSRARATNPGVEILQADLAALPNRTFDVILLNQVLEHVPDDRGLLTHLAGLLAPNGTLILGVPNEGAGLQGLRRALRDEGPTDHVHFYCERDMRRLVADAGLACESILREPFYPGINRLYYGLLATGAGYRLLAALTRFAPWGCSDVYMECRRA